MRSCTLLLASSWAASGLLLNPEVDDPEVRVLVYGDSWGAWGPSWHMVQDLLARKGVPHRVENCAISGTRACGWSAEPYSIVDEIYNRFGDKGVHFVWYTLGGNDLLDPDYLMCSMTSQSIEDATDCVIRNGNHSRGCTYKLLDGLWEQLPDVKVIQVNYDIACYESFGCRIQPRTPFCLANKTCANMIMFAWALDLCDELMAHYGGTGRYSCLNTFGTGQFSYSLTGATVGHPNISVGTPCSTMVACVHPKPSSIHAYMLGEVMWDQYFSKQIPQSMIPPVGELPRADEPPPPPPDNVSADEEQNREDIEVIDTYCNYNWRPTRGVEALSSPPPCVRSEDELMRWSR